MNFTDELILAPLLGVTNYLFRSVYSARFGGFDKAVIPFVTKGNFDKKNSILKRELLPEWNKNLPAISQILTNKPEDFIACAKSIEAIGEKELNWNLGCPYPQIIKKKRGGGFLPYIDEIKKFLDEVTPAVNIKVTIKTRLGINSAENIFKLIEVFNDYPISELIIHPRTVAQLYEGVVDLEAFLECLKLSKNCVVYNGDIFTVKDFKKLKERFPKVNKWMIGRGAVRNPLLAEKIRNNLSDECLTENDKCRIKIFHDTMVNEYKKILCGERHVLDKMKEIISYLSVSFTNDEKIIKKVKRSQTLNEYNVAVNAMFRMND